MSFKRFTGCLCLLLLALGLSNAQGLILDDERYDRLPRQPSYGDGGKSEASALEGIVKVDLRPFCPRPKHQGEISSCTGWATGYGAFSIAYAVQNNWAGQQKSITDSAFSALFLYNQIREEFENCNLGSHIDKALKTLQEKGNVASKDFDARPNNCKRIPTPEELAQAQEYRIKDWMTLFGSDAAARVKIDKTKLALASKKPVIIAMRLRNNFNLLNSDSKYWLPMLGDTTFSSAHAMVVVGFDDGKQAFEVMNSWGSSWGDNGFCWIRYADYAEHARYAYLMTLAAKPKPAKTVVKPDDRAAPETPSLFADVNIRYPTNFVDGFPVFENAQFLYKDGVYKLGGGTAEWPVGKLYQLELNNVKAESYVYAFSLDATGKIGVHWPRDSKFDEKFDGLNETAFVSNSKVRVLVPGERSALVLEQPGIEHICLFFCREPLKDFNQILGQIKALYPVKPVFQCIRMALGKRMAASSELTFAPDKVRFETSGTKGGIVPVLLEIRVK